MASSSSASSPKRYDVFLSFRGTDTRRKFISHLYRELQSKVATFKDDRVLQPGDSLPDEIPEAIKESKIAVVVISEDYASSRWCLMELEMIMGLKKKGTLEVFPIFYDVHPSDVRDLTKLKGTFGKAFQKHEGKETAEKVGQWREALTEVANLTGVVSQEWPEEEADMVRYVGENILERLLAMPPEEASDLIGMDTRLEELKPLLSLGSDDGVRMIGIWGMGGVGKTTIARYLFDKFRRQFQLCCFIDDVKKIYSERGRENLRRQFLSEILNDESLQYQSSHLNSNAIQDRLSRKMVLAILDDVDNLEQLEALAKQSSWFGPGSRIIITTRNKGLLISRSMTLVYEVKCLEHNVACSFFNHFAFEEALGGDQVCDKFKRLALCASKLVGGLPLALKVLGSFLRGRKISEWEVAVQRLRDEPRKDVIKCLKVSYDGLTKENQDIFLTVACLFNEKHANHVSQLLDVDGGESVARDSLGKLVEKALISISNDGKVMVHDLIHDMAKEIVKSELRPRFLVDCQKIHYVLAGAGTHAVEAIEGISLDVSEILKFPMGSTGFENMRNLKYLKINGFLADGEEGCLQIRSAIKHLPPRLRLLDWHACPLTTFPSTLHTEFLVELRLPHSEIGKLPEVNMLCGNLRRLNLSGCWKLKEISSLYETTELEELDLSYCLNLIKVPSSFSYLEKLTRLSMRCCTQLKFLPSTTGLNSLKFVDLCDCFGLKSFPELPKSVVEVYMSGTSIREVPESIQNLVALEVLDLSRSKELLDISGGIGSLTALETLNLSKCSMLLEIPNTLGNLQFIKELHLDNCENLESIPDSIGNLTGLKNLHLSSSKMFFEIPNAIGGLTAFDLSGCEMLSKIPATIGNLQSVKELCLQDCKNLMNIPDAIGNLRNLEILSLENCIKLCNIPSTVGNLSALTTLDFSGCEMLSEIPSTIGNLQSVKELYLRNCKNLRNIPDTVGNLTSLEILSLVGCNELGNIPSTIGNLAALTTLSLACCETLLEIPSSIGDLTALETLSLALCQMLLEIPKTIENLTSLKNLNLLHCTKLIKIPSTIGNLTALKTLCLTGCETLLEIPSTIGNLTALETLELLGCMRLSDIPITMGNLTSLKKLSPPLEVNCAFKILGAFCCGKQRFNASDIGKLLSSGGRMKVYCERAPESHAIEILSLNLLVFRRFGVPSHCTSLSLFPHLRKLSLCNCNIQEISNELGCLRALQSLDLSGNFFKVLPESIKQLSLLEELVLNDCKDLRIMPELPQGVKYLYANDCCSLESVSSVSGHPFLQLMLKGCIRLGEDPLLFTQHMISMPFHKEEVNAMACFSASEVPDCFTHGRKGQNLTIYCPQTHSNLKPVGFVAGVVVVGGSCWSWSSIQCHWQGKDFQFGHILVGFKSLPSHASFYGSQEDILIVFSYNFGEEKSSDKISFYFDIDFEEAYFPRDHPQIKGCGIHLCFTEESQRTQTLLTLGSGNCRQDYRRKQFEESSLSSEEEEECSESENSS